MTEAEAFTGDNKQEVIDRHTADLVRKKLVGAWITKIKHAQIVTRDLVSKKIRPYPTIINTVSLSYTVSVILDQVNNPSPRQLRQQPRHMIPQIPPSLRWLVHDLWTKRVRSPELDQQAVEVHPFPLNRFQSCVADEGRAG